MRTSTTTCRTCDGDCRIVHPRWQQYFAQYGVYTVDEFFLNLGWLPDEARPPLMVQCPTCQGVGVVPALVPATRSGSVGQWLYKLLGGAPL